jgi:hypothetical protein
MLCSMQLQSCLDLGRLLLLGPSAAQLSGLSYNIDGAMCWCISRSAGCMLNVLHDGAMGACMC